jgi:kynurenine formamidase
VRIVDLTFPITPHFRWKAAVEVRTSHARGDLFQSTEDHTTHYAFFPAGITVIEYLTNLDQIGASRCRFVALPLRIEGADGSPVRAVAFVD